MNTAQWHPFIGSDILKDMSLEECDFSGWLVAWHSECVHSDVLACL